MKLTLGYSSCPNDCFIFEAMIHQKVDTEGLDFQVIMEDVETLNKRAFKRELDITKLSFHSYMYVMNDYILLKSGSALGFNCGPLLVQRADCVISNIDTVKIAIPGIYTTANFLLSLAYPNAKNKIEMVFSDIEKAVLNGDADAGLIIHESRFTYGEKGLKKIADLGEFWETLIHAPIPLGGIVARRSFDENTLQKINRCIRRSIEYAFSHPESVMDYVQLHSQEMNKAVMKKHIELYVNEFSIDLGNTGSDAINLMVNTAMKKGLIHRIPSPLMIA